MAAGDFSPADRSHNQLRLVLDLGGGRNLDLDLHFSFDLSRSSDVED